MYSLLGNRTLTVYSIRELQNYVHAASNCRCIMRVLYIVSALHFSSDLLGLIAKVILATGAGEELTFATECHGNG